MGLEGMLNRDIDGLFDGICGSEKSRNAIYVRRTVLQRIILDLCNLLIYAYAGMQVWLGIITIGSVVAYASSMELFAGAVARLAVTMGHLKTAALYAAGLGTCVGKDYDEGGVAFSGVERQKLAIARAIYKDAPFVIMDEPTAALDPKAETEVFEGFDGMVGHKTAIYISHRLASCRFCEDILVFDRGKVVQHGTHEELEKQEGLYRELWNAQAQYYA
nr:ATP-binding cassette domain-containing protein [uncultured Acetatifactor sp.]